MKYSFSGMNEYEKKFLKKLAIFLLFEKQIPQMRIKSETFTSLIQIFLHFSENFLYSNLISPKTVMMKY